MVPQDLLECSCTVFQRISSSLQHDSTPAILDDCVQRSNHTRYSSFRTTGRRRRTSWLDLASGRGRRVLSVLRGARMLFLLRCLLLLLGLSFSFGTPLACLVAFFGAGCPGLPLCTHLLLVVSPTALGPPAFSLRLVVRPGLFGGPPIPVRFVFLPVALSASVPFSCSLHAWCSHSPHTTLLLSLCPVPWSRLPCATVAFSDQVGSHLFVLVSRCSH